MTRVLAVLLLVLATACASAGGVAVGAGSEEPDDLAPVDASPLADAGRERPQDAVAVLLEGRWTLVSGEVDGAAVEPVEDGAITLAITADGVAGSAGCNSYRGPLTVDDEALVGELAVTRMQCPDPVMDVERTYLAGLAAATDAELDGEELVLTGDGVALRYTAETG